MATLKMAINWVNRYYITGFIEGFVNCNHREMRHASSIFWSGNANIAVVDSSCNLFGNHKRFIGVIGLVLDCMEKDKTIIGV